MGAPRPDLLVQFAPTSNPFSHPYTWVDISDRLRSATTSRGRQSELDQIRAGTAAVNIDNRDRAFDPLNASSPYNGNLVRGKPVRLAVGYAYLVDGLNPAHYLRLDETSGSFMDMRSASNGTATGANVTRGVTGAGAFSNAAVELNVAAATSYITVPHVTALGTGWNTFSVEAAVRMSTPTNHTIWCKGFGSQSPSIRIDNTGKVTLYSDTSTVLAQTTGTPCSSQNGTTWYHVVVTKNGTGAGAHQIIVNGVNQTLSTNAAGSLGANSNAMRWGVADATGSTLINHLRGRLDEVAVYKTVLSVAQALEHYTALSGIEGAVFSGYLEELPQTFPASLDAVCQLKLTDARGITRDRPVLAAQTYATEVAADSPWGFWRFRERTFDAGTGSGLAADASGNNRPLIYGSADVGLGSTPLLTDSPSADMSTILLSSVATLHPAVALPTGPPFSFECTVQFDEPPTSEGNILSPGFGFPSYLINIVNGISTTPYGMWFGFEHDYREPAAMNDWKKMVLKVKGSAAPVGNDANEKIWSYVIQPFRFARKYSPATITPAVIFDGRPHILTVTCPSNFPTGAPTVYLDGVALTAAEAVTGVNTYWGGGAYTQTFDVGQRLAGRISEASFHTSALSSGRVTTRHAAVLRPWTGDKVGQRMDRLLTLTGWPAFLRDIDTGTTKAADIDLTTAGVDVLVDSYAKADAGLYYARADGKLAFVGRRAYATETPYTTSQMTLKDVRSGSETATDAWYMPGGFQYGPDRSLLRNRVSVGAVDDSIDPYEKIDNTSDAAYGTSSEQVTLPAAERIDLIGWAETRVNLYKDPLQTFSPMVIAPDDPARASAQFVAHWNALFALDIGYLVTASRTPKTGSPISRTCRIDGIEHAISSGLWGMRITTSARATSETMWILGTTQLQNAILTW